MTATVEDLVCDFCGASVALEANVEGHTLKYCHPVCRPVSFLKVAPDLWHAHPHYGKDICDACRDAGKFLADGLPAIPDGAILAARFEDGKMLDTFGDTPLAVMPPKNDSDRFLLLYRRHGGYFLPLLALDWLSTRLGSDLEAEREVVLSVQHWPKRRPVPLVVATNLKKRTPGRVRALYGADCALRMLRYGSDYEEALTVKLTVLS